VPVAGDPLVCRILRYAARWDARDLVLNLHYLPETITRYVGDGSDMNVRVRYSFESPVLGSAGGPRKALAMLPDDHFFIINGDTLTDVNLDDLAANHRSSGALVTIAVIPNEWPDRYSGLVVDASGRFHSVVPRGSTVPSYHVVGVQMAHPSAFARLPLDEPAESIGGVYKTLVKENPGAVRAFLCSTEFWDVGTPADYLAACLAIGQKEGLTRHLGERSILEDSARIIDTVIWDDVVVGKGASVERCVVADGVKIPAGANYQNCAIIQRDGELVATQMS
jgi:NDP-sugar pyrophosphorylase family protein